MLDLLCRSPCVLSCCTRKCTRSSPGVARARFTEGGPNVSGVIADEIFRVPQSLHSCRDVFRNVHVGAFHIPFLLFLANARIPILCVYDELWSTFVLFRLLPMLLTLDVLPGWCGSPIPGWERCPVLSILEIDIQFAWRTFCQLDGIHIAQVISHLVIVAHPHEVYASSSPYHSQSTRSVLWLLTCRPGLYCAWKPPNLSTILLYGSSPYTE